GGVGAGEDEALHGAIGPAPDAVDVDGGVEDQRCAGREEIAQQERLQGDEAKGLFEEIDDVRPRRADRLDEARGVEVPRAVAGEERAPNAPTELLRGAPRLV